MTAPVVADSTDQVLYEVDDGIATLTLNRPDRQNTITRPMLAAFSQRLVQANADPQVRVVIVTGAGRFFCAGLDLRGGSGIGEGKHAPTLDLREAPPTVLHHMDKPTLCALNGSSAGYGDRRRAIRRDIHPEGHRVQHGAGLVDALRPLR